MSTVENSGGKNPVPFLHLGWQSSEPIRDDTLDYPLSLNISFDTMLIVALHRPSRTGALDLSSLLPFFLSEIAYKIYK